MVQTEDHFFHSEPDDTCGTEDGGEDPSTGPEVGVSARNPESPELLSLPS